MKLIFNKYFVLGLIFILTSIFSVMFVHIPHWDWYNYQNYNGWAFLNNRIDIDYMPCLFRSYFNPVIESISYFLLDKLNNFPILFIITMSLKYTIFLFISYLIFKEVFTKDDENKFIGIISCLIMTAFSPVLLIAKVSGNDLQIGCLILLSFYLFIKSVKKTDTNQRTIMTIFSGLVLGCGVGLKYTTCSFVPALIVCLFVYRKKIQRCLKYFILLITSMFFGFVISDGWWMYMIYERFNNPLYPYFNNIFNPQDTVMENMFVKDFSHLRPNSILDFIFYPFMNNIGIKNVGMEFLWFDIKVSMTFVSVCFLCAVRNLKTTVDKFIDTDILGIIIFYTVISYYTNLILFAQMRYIIALIPLSAIIITVSCFILLKKIEFSKILLILCHILIFGYVIYAGRYDFSFIKWLQLIPYILFYFAVLFSKKWITSFSKQFFIVMNLFVIFFIVTTERIELYMTNTWYNKVLQVENLNFEDDSVVLTGYATSFIAPFQNKNVNYIGFSVPASVDIVKNKSIFIDTYFKCKDIDKKIESAFKNKKNIYFIYNQMGLISFEDLMQYMYIYTKNTETLKMKKDDCKESLVYILGQPVNGYYVCKIK